MIYLTWGIGFNGIFNSQVVGVCKYLSTLNNKSVTLVSFVPYPGYRKTKRKIKGAYSNSIILPMIPSRNHWWPLFAMLFAPIALIKGWQQIITRGVIANQMALFLRKLKITKRVVYDGRGALKAEWTEYDIVHDEKLVNNIGQWEDEAVNKSDFQLAVSHKLVEYWKDEFNYQGKEFLNYVVIPCTVNAEVFQTKRLKDNNLRLKYNYTDDDIILVYSGSAESWQSFDLIDRLLDKLLSQNKKVKVLFLAKVDLGKLKSYTAFKDRFNKMWVSPSEVNHILAICDYGLLIRENTVTNRVASPTKFAEYLAAGLKVIISEHVGDFSEIVESYELGIVIKSSQTRIELQANKEQYRIKGFASNKFNKKAFKKEYLQLLK